MNRREFFKKSLSVSSVLVGTSIFGWHNLAESWASKKSDLPKSHPRQKFTSVPDIVAVRNGKPEVMFDLAIAALGGISKFVKPNQKVVVKPNIGWDRGPESGANTNPLLVKRIVEHCLKAGAKKVYVFDNAVDFGVKTYQTSGIATLAKEGGALVVPANDFSNYLPIDIPGGQVLKKAQVHEVLLEADVFINVPVLKHHFASQVTISMKNLMGVVWDRMTYHRQGLHECIADFCLFRKPNLNVVDAYRVTMANGPQNAGKEDVALKKMLLLSADAVAVDAAATKILGVNPAHIPHIKMGHERHIGNMELNKLAIRKITVS